MTDLEKARSENQFLHVRYVHHRQKKICLKGRRLNYSKAKLLNMRFKIDDLEVFFPYDYIYPEQYEYMKSMKKVLDAQGHGVLEMPSGTGKTTTILSLSVAYQMANPTMGKIIYCSRTVPEIEKCLDELKVLLEYYEKETGVQQTFLGLGLSSRRKLCINKDVNSSGDGKLVDSMCRNLTASFVRQRAETDPNVKLCDFYEEFEKSGKEKAMPNGVYNLEGLKDFGREQGYCPYFLARHAIEFANVIVYSYYYLLDPKISELVSKQLAKESMVIFDEAHNIDNVCIESLSIDISLKTLKESTKSLTSLKGKLKEIREEDANRLKGEYERLVEGLQEANINRSTDVQMGNPFLPDAILQEAVPGNIRRADHFVAFLQRFVEYLATVMKPLTKTIKQDPNQFTADLRRDVFIERKPLKFCSERLGSLLRTLELNDLDKYNSLGLVTMFATLIGQYSEGFSLIIDSTTQEDSVLHFSCMDASICIKPVFERFQSVIITSGTLSPLDMYPTILGFEPVLSKSFPMTLSRQSILPMIVTKGDDQLAVSSQFNDRLDMGVIRNYGLLLVDLVKCVPDGIVCFFVSYTYMESIVSEWHKIGFLNTILKSKLLFVETQDRAETALALDNYQKACRNGRGAVLFSVARGKVSEGVDFDHEYGRAVIMFGIPFVYTENNILRARLDYLRDKFKIQENDFLTFDAMRHAAQCVGRVLRSKTDYGIMIFADKRYKRSDKIKKLPKWMQDYLGQRANMATQDAISASKNFLREMAQPFTMSQQIGHALLNAEQLQKLKDEGE